MQTLNVVVLTAAALATPPPMSGHVTVTGAWFRALPAHLPAGGYFELHNSGPWLVKLTGASSPGCAMLMLHRSERKSGIESMSDVSEIDVPIGSTLKFAPGGYHLMCMDPAPAMKPGASVSVTLKFSDGSELPGRFAVKNASGR